MNDRIRPKYISFTSIGRYPWIPYAGSVRQAGAVSRLFTFQNNLVGCSKMLRHNLAKTRAAAMQATLYTKVVAVIVCMMPIVLASSRLRRQTDECPTISPTVRMDSGTSYFKVPVVTDFSLPPPSFNQSW